MDKETIVDIEFTPEDENLIKSYAGAHRMSVSEYIIEAVREKIESPEEMVDVEVFIPLWLDRKVRERHINLSDVLQKALISKLNEKDGH